MLLNVKYVRALNKICVPNQVYVDNRIRGRSQTTLTRFFFDHLTPCVDNFYGMNVDKKLTFLDHLPTSSCKRNL